MRLLLQNSLEISPRNCWFL